MAGDVGGTKTLLGLFERRGGRLHSLRENSFASAAFSSFEAMLREFRADGRERVSAAAIGVAGPIVGDRSQIVNLKWPVELGRVRRAVGTSRVALLNDLEATAWGIPELGARDSLNLTPRLRGATGNAALIAAGTGLGMALLVRDGNGILPVPSEGGHQGFSPRDARDERLLRFLRRRHGRVSLERVVSGPGLAAIDDFLGHDGSFRRARTMAGRIAKASNRPAAIAEAALADEDPRAAAALDLFVAHYGAAAGDLALVARASGGVWIGGGIAPRILPRLRSKLFLDAFREKGRLSPFIARIPVRVILEPRAALLGAAARAERLV